MMNYIEIIGPPATGKTTLLKTLTDLRDEGAEWKSYQEAAINIARNLGWSQMITTQSKLLYLLNKGNISNYKKFGISNKIIRELTSDIPNSIQQKYEYLIEAQLKAIQSIELQVSAHTKCSLLNWHLQSLQRIFILETFQYEPTVLLSEGPFKTHYGLNHIDLTNIRSDTLPKAVIYCSLDIDENIKRVKTRKVETGRLSTIHNELNRENLEQLVLYTHETAARNFTFIKSIGIPTIEVDLTYPLHHTNLMQLNQFIKTYSSMHQNLMFNYAVI